MRTPETRDAALLPCPRCGSPVSAHAGAFGDWWDIQCTAENCRLHLPDAGETEARAIAAWNRRAAPREPGEAERTPGALARALDRAQDQFAAFTSRERSERFGVAGAGIWVRLNLDYLHALAELALPLLAARPDAGDGRPDGAATS